jgi:hypothetical protein
MDTDLLGGWSFRDGAGRWYQSDKVMTVESERGFLAASWIKHEGPLTIVDIIHTLERIIRVIYDERPSQSIAVLRRIV